uniref:C-type lectin domain-containing protein n=1 Tax=Fundulus heteroclitus TaxID=8078 RepID=A0A3Q2P5Q2_FUNHE
MKTQPEPPISHRKSCWFWALCWLLLSSSSTDSVSSSVFVTLNHFLFVDCSLEMMLVKLYLLNLLSALVLLVTREAVRTLKEENEGLRKRLLGETLSCEAGWELHGGNCHNFSTRRSSWNESRDSCKDLGGDLVKIDSIEEQRRVGDLMKYPEDMFWIGLTDSQEEGRWLWVDGSPLDTCWNFWRKGQPDDLSANNLSGADCGRMGDEGGPDDLKCWHDRGCDYRQKSICEKAAGALKRSSAGG